jgi:dTDP-4-dehydrorhamnose reductase
LVDTILVAGAGGQLGRELASRVPAQVHCHALGREQFDLTDPDLLVSTLDRLAPGQVINAAAYTAVDAAETEVAQAWAANCEGPRQLARACAERGIRLLHVSTDFVFDGESAHPYTPDAPPAPLGEYGRSKLAGERAVVEECPEAFLVRTGWVYSRFGGNFVKTMLRLMAERDELSVVCDQVGTPTWASGLADTLWAAAARPQLRGVYHWSDAGVCSWYDFAVAIHEEAMATGLLTRPVQIRPIPASDYPTPARRPAFSVLDKRGSWRDLELEAVHWRQQLRAMLRELQERHNA